MVTTRRLPSGEAACRDHSSSGRGDAEHAFPAHPAQAHGVGGALFLVFGLLMLYSVFKPGPDVAPVIQAAEKVPAAEPPEN